MSYDSVSYNDVLIELQDYMFYDDNLHRSLRYKLVNDNPRDKKDNKNHDIHNKKHDTHNKNHDIHNKNHDTHNEKQDNPKILPEKPSLFIPKEQDSLFWCYYIIKNGDAKYEMLNHKNMLMAKQMKIDYVEYIRKNKPTIKTYKFDTLTNIESNLVNDNNINIKTVFALCAIENINLIYVRKRTYYDLAMNDSEVGFIIREIPANTKYNYVYGFELSTPNKIAEIKSTLYKLDSIDKPIKSISAYKSEDIINIANKLSISTINVEKGKNKTKKDIYEAIIQYF
jgi:hypothetical protein